MSDAGPELETPLLRRVLEIVRAEVDPEFAFRWPGPLPWSPLERPLAETTVALVTTSGTHLRDDAPFRALQERFGDTSRRVVGHDAPEDALVLDAPYVDQRHTARDPEVALPRRALEHLHGEGVVGPPARRHHVFCGGIVRALPGLARSAEAVARDMAEDGARAAVLLPTCSLCVQTVCILARELEARGASTVTLSFLPELSRVVGAPRTLSVHFPFGAPCGDPGNEALQRAVLREALELLATASQAGELAPSRHAWRSRAPA